jgi:2-polyprenyl-6-hydroxyphenyl methylase/3-demethylubiquinone-9 3-methyltransferase
MNDVVVEDGANLRFAFGRNWQRFLTVLNDERIQLAEESLRTMLGTQSLSGRTFIDVGSGSGLFSLAAMRLGAIRVHSFDYDSDSVACTQELKRRYFPEASSWTVEQGSVLDQAYLGQLDTWDVVYSWGVLHHTGHMHDALANVATLVAESGQLFIAIYNDQGLKSRVWWWIKKMYNKNSIYKVAIVCVFVPYYVVGGFVIDIMRGTNPINRFRAYTRGMSHVYDWFDWLGGYPFEVASRGEITSFYNLLGFSLNNVISCESKLGCNEFVFSRCSASCS